ncbi:MAG: SH3 domain-containing protein [Rhodobacterales bacterium]|nr:SH3 domain-containing protein [Rhodobacterales bacterium]
MFAALMTLGTDRGQLRPGLALAASEGRLDAVWAEARSDAEPAVAPQSSDTATGAETMLAAAQPEPLPITKAAPPVAADSEAMAKVAPLGTVVQAVEEPVFTLSNLGNELVPGEDGTPVETAVADVAQATDGTAAIEPAALTANSADPALPEALPGNVGTVWYVNASSVNVRSAPDTGAEVVGKLGAGEAALMVAAVDGQWARIVIQGDGMEGYVALRYLTPEAP